MTIEVTVPALGESVTEATVATWFRKPGDRVAADEMLCELETDKVTVEVPAPAAGVLKEILAPEGTTVQVGAPLALIEEAEAAGEAPAHSPAPAAAAPADEAAPAPAAEAAETAAPAGQGAAGEGEVVTVTVPTLGESVTEATVAGWFRKEGETVGRDEVLCELETDKVSLEVPAPAAGTLARILAPEGTTVEVGAPLAEIVTGEGAAAAPAAPARTVAAGSSQSGAKDAPSARRLMEEQGIDRTAVTPTGKGGRVLKEDVLRAVADREAAPADAAPAAPQPAPGPATPPATKRAPVPAEDAAREERVRMTRLRQTIARRLKDAQNTAAMLTTFNEVDMSAVMALRNRYKELFLKKHGVKLGFMSFFARACAQALMEIPEINAEIDGDTIIYKHYVHMGIAVGTPQGLVVPVIRDVQDLSFAEIEKRLADLSKRAREGRLSLAEMQGGTFTISNGGVYGSLFSTPILNPPQSGILGMHKIQERPVAIDGEVVIRPMMYLALSYDHRIVDGKGAVTFLVRVKELIEDPSRLVLDL